MSNAIETRGLRYRAGKDFEIRDLSLNVREGSIYGFLGPNGAGKTTTIQLLLGQLRPLGGAITLLGRRVPQGLPAILAETGYVPERPHLYPFFTVEEAIRYHSVFFSGFDQAYAGQMLTTFELPTDRKVSRLSKGEMGKLHVLLVLAQKPRLLVLDEPTDGLDPVVRRDVLSALLEFCSGRAATVFISSHLVHELERVCDWVGLLDRGRLVAELPMEAFKNGIKRIRLAHGPAAAGATPFEVVSRVAEAGGEAWVVHGWEAPMAEWFRTAGAELRAIEDLDLEDGFVEMLRAARGPGA